MNFLSRILSILVGGSSKESQAQQSRFSAVSDLWQDCQNHVSPLEVRKARPNLF